MGECAESRGVGPVDTKLAERNCCESACDSAAAVSLDQQALCLNHFLLRCYTKLEAVDPRGQKSREERVDLASMRAFIEECSHKEIGRASCRERVEKGEGEGAVERSID